MATEIPTAVGTLTAEEILEDESPGLWTQAFRRLRKNRAAIISLVVIVLLYVVAVFATQLAPYDPNDPHFGDITKPPAWSEDGNPAYLLGTDSLGRDILSRVIFGSRISMTIGLIPIFFYLIIGG